jgi:hypothetical protein
LVVPLLAEAIGQTGRLNVMVVAPTQDKANELMKQVREAGYATASATSPEGAVVSSQTLPSVDVILMPEELTASEIEKLFRLATSSARLERAPRLIITATKASPWAAKSLEDILLNVTQATESTALKEAIENSRKRAGSIPMDEALATSYASRSADLLTRLAVSRNPNFDLAVAMHSLLTALGDTRPDIVKAASVALSTMNSKDAQAGLLVAAVDEKTPESSKSDLFKNLAINAKYFGNRLDANQVELLQKALVTGANLEIRSAAAEASGALDLPVEQAKTLILDRAK